MKFFSLSIAILQLSNLLVCPVPIPKVVCSFAITIAFDFTKQEILKAKIRSFKVFALGLILETTLKFFSKKSDYHAFEKELNLNLK